MQVTSDKYKEIMQKEHSFEVSLVIGKSGRLVTEKGEAILFGGAPILINTGTADSGFKLDSLFDVTVTSECFNNAQPGAGAANASYIDVTMIAPFNIPKKSIMRLYVRAISGSDKSEWLNQGVFYVDTRQQTKDDRGFDTLVLHGYDAMLLAEVTWPSSNMQDYPMLDKDMIKFIAKHMRVESGDSGISVDPRTWEIMDQGYRFNLPSNYSMREVLGMIAAAYAGNFIISPNGELRLVRIFDMPKETSFLITEAGYVIVFGDTRIIL